MAHEEVLKKVVDQTVKGIETLKVTAEKAAKSATDEVGKEMNAVAQQATKHCQDIQKDSDNEAKKHIKVMIEQGTEAIKETENRAVTAIKNSWETTRNQLNKAFAEVSETLGSKKAEVEKILNNVIAYMEKVIADCIKTIHEYAVAAQKTITEGTKNLTK